MEINNLLVAIIVLSVFAGIGIGITFSGSFRRDSRRLRDLEESLAKEREHLGHYEEKVLAHFSQTARLVNKLTDSYREVHTHLANGAEELCRGESREIFLKIEEIKKETSIQEDIQPPLDYAPKTSPKQRGVLNESFGIEKEDKDEGIDIDLKNQ